MKRVACVLIVMALMSCTGAKDIPSAARSSFAPVTAPDGVTPALLSGYAQFQQGSEHQRIALQQAGAPHVFAATQSGGLTHVLPIARRPEESSSALVLYDTGGQWGFLGELYAIAAANLAGHFGTVDAEPISAYQQGQLAQYTGAIYIGSTYDEPNADPIPPAFYTDVASRVKPVLWLNDNIWNFASSIGRTTFENEYGWDPLGSYFDPGGTAPPVTTVQYKGRTFTRTVPAARDAGTLHPVITSSALASVPATATDSSGNSFPWAVRSANLTYVSEVPFDYMNETDRVIALTDLLFDVLSNAPNATVRHRALLRLDDISAQSDPAVLQAIATYLAQAKVPYTFSVVPLYEDPLGRYHSGTATSEALSQAPAIVSVIRYMAANGGTLISAGYTHQYGNAVNPYTGASPDDAEFFRAHVTSNNAVSWDGPVPGDSPAWAQGRIASSDGAFTAAGIAPPQYWTTPNYFATDLDYEAVVARYSARIERSVYYNGLLAKTAINYGSYIGQFFPYAVTDAYGGAVLPENLGDFGAAHTQAYILNAAQLNLAVRDGVAGFAYDAAYGPSPLQSIVTQMQGMGYQFVSPNALY